MKITAPISSIKELEMLLANGCDELYAGIIPESWESGTGLYSAINRRNMLRANFTSFEELKRVVETSDQSGIPVHITLNSPFYPESSLPLILDLCKKLVYEVDVAGLIISDLNLLYQLNKIQLPVRLHLSSLGGCYNSASVAIFKKLGIQRIILSRQFHLSEIQQLVRKNRKQMEFEVFAVNDGCLFDEGHCQTSHELGPFCMSDWELTVRDFNDGEFSRETIDHQTENLKTYLWFQNNCGSEFQEDGLPNGPCSLCRFSLFNDWGVVAVKIVGREGSFHRKMASLQLAKAVMDEVRTGKNHSEIMDIARAYRNTPELCNHGYMCYFRDLDMCEEEI